VMRFRHGDLPPQHLADQWPDITRAASDTGGSGWSWLAPGRPTLRGFNSV
jgi:hypothetical protein